MYNTVREVHVDIEQRIQQITSNRHRSIPSEYIDMVLNRAVYKLIEQKLSYKTNVKQEGFEDSKLRTDDLQRISKQKRIEVIYDDYVKKGSSKGYIKLPTDYYKYISSNSSKLYYNKPEIHSYVTTVFTENEFSYIKLQDIQNAINECEQTSIFNFTISGGGSVNIDVTSCIGATDLFPLKTLFDLNLYFSVSSLPEETDGEYTEYCISDWEIATAFIVEENPISIPVLISIQSENWIDVSGVELEARYAPNDLVKKEEYGDLISSHYSNKNRHLNPITFISEDKLYIHCNEDFIVREIILNYIKRPIEFNIRVGTMPEVPFIDEIVDYAVSDLLLILKDNAYSSVKQQNILDI